MQNGAGRLKKHNQAAESQAILSLVAETEEILIVDVHQAAKSSNFREFGISECSSLRLQKAITQNLEGETEFVAR